MARVKEKYRRSKAEKRFARVYDTVEGDSSIYCGMPNDGIGSLVHTFNIDNNELG